MVTAADWQFLLLRSRLSSDLVGFFWSRSGLIASRTFYRECYRIIAEASRAMPSPVSAPGCTEGPQTRKATAATCELKNSQAWPFLQVPSKLKLPSSSG